ncbi:DUF3089 domain-containing protein [Parasphingorhabdus halotolerans]|uniref:Uncharacterized protein n=1 Tax=Parasphingorhabdus halotolerans TaxID=2725558 RepID=A0A6H2DKC3_9SPHN|nr:DUF3089 domain-containing protein [Parasphingorhabdus halotolerans]QJB68794.1 hypothetical protein HF685_05450 [Parasphingorhabdus halotolerans]
MKKWIIGIGVILVLVLGTSYLFREKLMFAAMEWQAKPTFAYDDAKAPLALDYANDESWAALPQTKDEAVIVPEELTGQGEPSDVAVFFIHPTTFLSKAGWNAPTDDPDSSEFQSDLFDDMPMLPGEDNYHVLDFSLFYASIRKMHGTGSRHFWKRYRFCVIILLLSYAYC